MPKTQASVTRCSAFTLAYLECALWSSTDNSRDNGGDPLDDNYGIEDMAQSCIDSAIEDCDDFVAAHAELIGDQLEQAGHDFWLTRNGHGAGFWDRDPSVYPKDPRGKVLTAASEVYGSVNLYIGDDGLIYS